MNDDRLNLRVGAFVLLGLIAAVVAVLALQGKHLRPGLRLHVTMAQTGAVDVGREVRVSGKAIGTVDRIRIDKGGTVVLDLWIDRRYRWMVRENSELFVNQQNLLGEAYIEVGPPRGELGPAVHDGETLKGVDPPRLDRLVQISYENMVAVTNLFREDFPEIGQLGAALDELEATLSTIDGETGGVSWTNTVRLYHEGQETSAWVDDTGITGDHMAATRASAGATLANARHDLAELRERFARLSERLAPLGDRLDPARFARLSAAISRGEAIAAKLDHITATVQAVVAMVDAGQGTIGSFLQDREIADEIKQMTKLMKSQPWRAAGNRRNRDAKGPIVP